MVNLVGRTALLLVAFLFPAAEPPQNKTAKKEDKKEEARPVGGGSRPGRVAATVAGLQKLRAQCRNWVEESGVCENPDASVRTSGNQFAPVEKTSHEGSEYRLEWTCPPDKAQAAVRIQVNAANTTMPPRRYRLETFEDCGRGQFSWTSPALQKLSPPLRNIEAVVELEDKRLEGVRLLVPREAAK